MDNDLVLPFTLYDSAIRGRVIRLDNVLEVILAQHQYSDEIARILADLLMVAALLGTQFKDEVTLTVQLQIKDQPQYIIVDFQSPGNIRGYAQFNPLHALSHEAFLSITIDHRGKRYQGIIDIDEMNISKAVEKYFLQSEQIATSLKLVTWNVGGSYTSAGIMIQKLPDIEDRELWHEANIFFSTIRDAELIDGNLPLNQLLYNLYHEAAVKVYESTSILHQCRCSHQRAEEIVTSLGHQDAKSLIINGILSVNCQFCNCSQNFTEDEIEQLFKSSKT